MGLFAGSSHSLGNPQTSPEPAGDQSSIHAPAADKALPLSFRQVKPHGPSINALIRELSPVNLEKATYSGRSMGRCV